MNIMFVVGGSYKAFYINHLNKCKNLDFLVFQENILYEYNYYNELCGEKVVTTEMLELAKKLNCIIIAKIKTNLFGKIENELLFSDGEKVSIINKNKYIKIFFNNKTIIFTQEKNFYGYKDLLVVLTKNRFKFKNMGKFNGKYAFVCYNNGVELKKKNKIVRKFRKICYFSLKI